MDKTEIKNNATYVFCESISGKENADTILHTSFNKDKLIFKFCCKEKFFCPRHKEYNAPLFDGDIVELMLTLGDMRKYLEIEVNQHNAQYCVLIDNETGRNFDKITKLSVPVIESEVKIDKEYWECVIIIKTEDLVKLGWQEDNCFANAHRQSYTVTDELLQYSLNSAYEPNFHIVKAFLKLNCA